MNFILIRHEDSIKGPVLYSGIVMYLIKQKYGTAIAHKTGGLDVCFMLDSPGDSSSPYWI